MNSAERARLLRERLRTVNPLSGQPSAPGLANPPYWLRRAEEGRRYRYYLPRKNGPKEIVKWVQTPDPEPPIFDIRLPQSALVSLAQRWFEEWQAKQMTVARAATGQDALRSSTISRNQP